MNVEGRKFGKYRVGEKNYLIVDRKLMLKVENLENIR